LRVSALVSNGLLKLNQQGKGDNGSEKGVGMKEHHRVILADRMDRGALDKLLALQNDRVLVFVAEAAALCRPRRIMVCDDSAADRQAIRNLAIESGEELPLVQEGHTVHFDAFRDCREHDQARDKAHTAYLVEAGTDLGAGINVLDRQKGLAEVRVLLDGIMAAKTMLVRFYCLAPTDSAFSIPCIQITDSAYVAHSEDLLFRPGYETFRRLAPGASFFRMLHAAGRLEHHVCADLEHRRIYIDLAENLVYSVNTQYGGNSIGLKKLALRLAINKASQEGWLAEHMFVMGVHGPGGRISYVTGAYPSACGKTSTAMLARQSIVGDDIAYLRVIDGETRAVNVEHGMYGIIENVNPVDDPELYRLLHEAGEIIFSNVLVHEGRPYWLGMGKELPCRGLNYAGQWYAGQTDRFGHPVSASYRGNARFAARLEELANRDSRAEDPNGVPVAAIIYGGRDSSTLVPIVESYDWTHGVVSLAASLESETTAAAMGAEGVRKLTPMANLDFLSIPLGQYIGNHLAFGVRMMRPPMIFGTNYWLRDDQGEFLNSKRDKAVWLQWIERRVHREVPALDGPMGRLPFYEDLARLFDQVLGVAYAKGDYETQFSIRIDRNLERCERIESFYRRVKDVPAVVFDMLTGQRRRLERLHTEYGDRVSPFQLQKRQQKAFSS
jgi:phosphoenolpyruvate carboxykinase (GTP)